MSEFSQHYFPPGSATTESDKLFKSQRLADGVG